jgi:hypothetical protein
MLIRLFILILSASSFGELVSKARADDNLILENKFVKAVISPDKGGALTSFKSKDSGTELLAGPCFLDSNILPGRRIQTLGSTAFTAAAILGNGATGWSLTARLPSDKPIDFGGQMVGRVGEIITFNQAAIVDWPRPYQLLLLTKKFSLPVSSAVLTVEYEIKNTGKEVVEICLGTTHSFAGSKLSMPTREGAASFSIPVKDPFRMPLTEYSTSPWLYDVPSAWCGMVNEEGRGVVGAFDSRHISFLRPDLKSGSVLLGRTKTKIEPGKTFRTSGWLMPLKKVNRIVGAANNVVAEFQVTPASADGKASLVRKEFSSKLPTNLEVGINLGGKKKDNSDLAAGAPDAGAFDETELTEEEKVIAELEGEEALNKVKMNYDGSAVGVRLLLESAVDREARISFRMRRNPHGEWHDVTKRSVRLLQGNAVTVDLKVSPKEVGTHIVQAIVESGGKELARFEQPVIAHHPSGFFLPGGPVTEGEVNREFYYSHVGARPMWPYKAGWRPSMEIERPHFDLAPSLAGGALKALFITPHIRTREIIELAHRMDLDYDCVVTGVGGYGIKTGGRKRAAIDQIDLCRSALNKKHEVIVLPIFLGQWLTLDIVEEIARQVREDGVGLVLPLPEHLFGSFAKFNERATADDCPPHFRKAQVGKGRVVILDGNSQELFTNWMCGTVKMTDTEVSHFAKMLLWAAGRQPGVYIELDSPKQRMGIDRSAGAAQFQFRLENERKKAFKGKLRVVARQDLEKDYTFYPRSEMLRSYRVCRLWDDRATGEAALSIPANGSQTVPISFALPAGNLSLDAYVLDESGGTLTWERFPINLEATTDIASIRLISGVRNPRDIVFSKLEGGMKSMLFTSKSTSTLKLSCGLTKSQNIKRIALVATDPWDRTVSSIEHVLEPEGANREVEFTVPLNACLHRVLIVSIRAFDEFGCVRERRLCGFIHPRPESLPAYEFRAYAEASEMDRSITGYDARVGAAPFSRALLHAWFNVSVQAWLGGPPTMKRVSVPGEVLDDPPELPSVGAITPTDKTGAPEKEDQDDVDIEIESKPIDPRDGWVRLPCINNPGLRKAMHSHIHDLYSSLSFFGPFSGGWGDEWYITKQGELQSKENPWRRSFVPGKDTNSCRCVHCLKLFRPYAKRLFNGDLKALNTEWETAFKSWEEVDRPITNKTLDDLNAPPESQWARVIDHRRFDDYRVAELLKEGRDVVKAIEPQNRLGWGDIFKTSLCSGVDAYLMSQYCDNNQLDRDQIKWASFGTNTNAHWVGYHKKYSAIRENFTPWWMMFRGNTSITYYGKRDYPMHQPDFTFFEAPKEMFSAMHEIRRLGFDKLLVGHQQIDPVAIHYDPASIYIAQMEDWKEDAPQFIRNMYNAGRAYNELCHQIEQTWKGLLSGRGLLHFATAYGQLEEGHFGRFGTPKILFLPYTQCVSPKQADTLERFVKEGGVLVGDIHTGLRDGHGKRLEAGLLDHVFGIKRKASRNRMRIRANVDGKPIPVRFGPEFGEPFELAFNAVGPGDVVPVTAKPFASYPLGNELQPAFLVNEFGKGKAIYLNFVATGYRVVENEGRSDEVEVNVRELKGIAAARFQAVFQKLLGYTDIRLAVQARGCSLWRFADNTATYICLGRGYKGNPDMWRTPYEVRLDQKRHVYDSRRGQYVGFTDRFDAQFSIDQKLFALVYAALPYKVEEIDLSLKRESVKQGSTLLFTATIGPAQAAQNRHVISMKVLNPEGEEVSWYGTVLETKKGIANGRIDLAYSDVPGVWKMQLMDTATGVSVEKEFEVIAVSAD